MTTMTNTQIDAAVAERVMGWTEVETLENHPGSGFWSRGLPPPDLLDKYESACGCSVGVCVTPTPTTDANDDYQVLVKVREGWELHPSRNEVFITTLKAIFQDRSDHRSDWYGEPLFYEPGDYAHAALSVLDAEATA